MELGIDCGGTKCEGMVFKAGNAVDRIIIEKPSTKAVLFELISVLLERNPGVGFIGIGFCAPVRYGRVAKVNNIKGWDNANIQAMVQKRFGVKCKVENDAKCFALAEANALAGKSMPEIVVGITLGTGIGCGIVINGRILVGATGSAGEINRIPMGKSILEDYTSKKYFSLRDMDAKEAFMDGKGAAKRSIEAFADNLGRMLAMVVLTVDPEVVVFGGSISKSFSKFRGRMITEMRKHIYIPQAKKVRIMQSKVRHAACIGASMLGNIRCTRQ